MTITASPEALSDPARSFLAGPHELRLIGLPHPAAAVPDLLDRKPALGMKHLREFGRQKPIQFLDSHRRLRLPHPIPLAALAGLPRSDTMPESEAQRPQ